MLKNQAKFLFKFFVFILITVKPFDDIRAVAKELKSFFFDIECVLINFGVSTFTNDGGGHRLSSLVDGSIDFLLTPIYGYQFYLLRLFAFEVDVYISRLMSL